VREPLHRRWTRRLAPIAARGLLAALPWASTSARAQDPAAAQAPGMAPYTETIPGTGLRFPMLPIPGGTFVMGSPEAEANRGEDEGPRHPVSLAPFWMGKCEVTWDEFDQFAFSKRLEDQPVPDNAAPKDPAREKVADAVSRPTPPYADETHGHGRRGQPVICITHHAALEYTRWLSAKTGKTYRLPTEAEWEYACRAGTTTAYSFGDDPATLGDYAWDVDNAEKPQAVGKKKPNPWGLHDMHGNVAEWCLDHYVADIYRKLSPDKPTPNPLTLPTGKEYPYVARGGSWDDDADKLRSAARRFSDREWSVRDPQRPQSIWWHTDATFIGFRVVRPLEELDELKGFRSPVIKGKGSR